MSLKPTPHPLLPMFTDAEVAAIVARPGGDVWYADWFNKRETLIRLAETDPLGCGFEPEYTFSDGVQVKAWSEADTLLEQCEILGVFGGNRAGKSWWAAKRVCQAARAYPKGVIVCLAEKLQTSIATMQQIVWFYLEPYYRHINGKRDMVTKIGYSQANGFTENKIVLPNRTEIYFLTYEQKAGDYEGWEFGAKPMMVLEIQAELRAKGQFVPPNIGAWGDESMTLAWLQMFSRRLKFRKAKMAWTFTPIRGITPAIKELVGATSKTLRTLPAELLATRKNLPELPKGHMPFVQETPFPRSRAIYFFSILNPFGGYYGEIKELCAPPKTSEFLERIAYGYARDLVARAFPNFGPWNIVKREHLPSVGTNYMLTDPAGTRNWATIWVRVTPGNPPNLHIYRDWPDKQRYGEWAVPTERDVDQESKKGWDGDQGPAQAGLGYGIFQYKRMFLDAERIFAPAAVVDIESSVESPEERLAKAEPMIEAWDGEPYHKAQVRRALANCDPLAQLREFIKERQIDPRAGHNEHVAEKGGTCLVDEFARPSSDGKTQLPPMIFRLASGVSIDEGLTAINTLLNWDKDQPLIPLLNAPRLYVCENCQQVRWALENYTGRGGETGACKDFVDLVRYMALGRLRYTGEGIVKTLGGGSY